MRKAKILLFMLVFLSLFITSFTGYGLSILDGKLNEEIHVVSGAKPVSAEGSTSLIVKWLKNGKEKTYVALVRFPVVPGEKYTLLTRYPIDGKGRGYILTGSDPEKSKGGWVSFQVPDASKVSYYKCKMIAKRSNISISKDSNSFLYVIYTTRFPSLPITFKLIYPPVPDSVVEKSHPYPGCNPQADFYWGDVWERPLLLKRDPHLFSTSTVKYTGKWKEATHPQSTIEIKRMGSTYFISLHGVSSTFTGTGVKYNKNIVGTLVSKDGKEAGHIRISSDPSGEMILEFFTLNCTFKWKKAYIK